VLYDLSSSYFEGSHCPMARLRVHTRTALLAATEESLQKIQVRVAPCVRLVVAYKIYSFSCRDNHETQIFRSIH
jgi:hypothetical protein